MRRAISFLTVIGGQADPAPSALLWFPVVGALLGLVVGGAWWLAAKLWAPVIAAAVAVSVDAVLTGYLHLDGLADSADGLLPPLGRERRLEVMSDPRIGAFGIVTVAIFLLLRFAAFASMPPRPLAIAGIWCLSRTIMAVSTAVVPYARPTGLASAFLSETPSRRAQRASSRVIATAALGVSLAVTLLVLARGAYGPVALVVELAAACAVILLARRRIGGFTGDVLGAAGVTGETAALLVLAAHW